MKSGVGHHYDGMKQENENWWVGVSPSHERGDATDKGENAHRLE